MVFNSGCGHWVWCLIAGVVTGCGVQFVLKRFLLVKIIFFLQTKKFPDGFLSQVVL